MMELTVDLGARSYPIYIGRGLLEHAGAYLKRSGIGAGSPLLVVTDDGVAPHYLESLKEQLEADGYTVSSFIIPAGEKSKSISMFEKIITYALEAGLDRKSVIVALGGGVVGDLAGFAAAAYMRGIRFVQIPTTILAHDSAVGGKVAVNHPLAKKTASALSTSRNWFCMTRIRCCHCRQGKCVPGWPR